MIAIKFKPSRLIISLLFLAWHSVQANPIQMVKLHGTFHQMGQQYAEQMGDTLLKQMDLTKKNLYPEDPELKKKFEQKIKFLLQIAKHRYPQEIMDFIKGEVDTDYARQHNLKLEDFIYLDSMTFLIKVAFEFNKANSGLRLDACSFIGTKDSSVVIGRNMDFPRDYMQSITAYPVLMSLEHTDKDKYPNKAVAVAFPGGISAATFMNDKGHYISINAASNTPTDAQFIVLQRPSFVGNMLLAVMQVKDFTALKNWVMDTAPDYPYIVNIAGPDANDLLSMEDLAYNELQGHYPPNKIPADVFKVRPREPGSVDTIEPENDVNEHILVATNTFHLTNWEPYLNHELGTQTPTFSFERYHNLMQLARTKTTFNNDTLKSLMEQELNTNQSPAGATVNYCGTDAYYEHDFSATYYSVVFNTQTKTLFVRYQQKDDASTCASHWTEWMDVNIS